MDRKTSSVKTLKSAVKRFLEKNNMGTDVSYYTKEEWEARGETVGKDAILTVAGEGHFSLVFNLMLDWKGCTDIIDRFGVLLEKHGYWYEMGHMWTMHIYSLEAI